MREKLVVVGISPSQAMLVVGDRDGKPLDDPRVADKLLERCKEDHPLYEFIVLPIQKGPMSL